MKITEENYEKIKFATKHDECHDCEEMLIRAHKVFDSRDCEEFLTGDDQHWAQVSVG